MVNKSIVVQMEGFWRVCRQTGGQVGLNGSGVGILGGGGANRISRRRGHFRREMCHRLGGELGSVLTKKFPSLPSQISTYSHPH